MSASVNMKITSVGNSAVFNSQNTGINLNLTHIQFGSGNRLPDGTESGLVAPMQASAISSGIKVSSTQIRMSALFTGAATGYPIGEIGIWSGDPAVAGSVLFAYWSQASGQIAQMSVGVDFVFSHDMVIDASIGSVINVVVDPSASTAVALLAAHVGSDDPHQQYAFRRSTSGIFVSGKDFGSVTGSSASLLGDEISAASVALDLAIDGNGVVAFDLGTLT